MDVKLNGVRAKMNPSRGRYNLVGTALGLDAVDLGGESGVVAQEVDRLACGVNLCLIEVLALSEHTGCVDYGAVLACEQVSYLEHDGGADRPVQLGPLLVSVESRLDGHPDLLGTGLVICRQHMGMVVRHNHLAGVACTHFLTADNQGNIQFDAALSLELGFEGYPLGRAFQIGFHRFVCRQREIENCIFHTLWVFC